ncbi:hypothetical protein Tco_1220998, partial [Tanacetum coccineum]
VEIDLPVAKEPSQEATDMETVAKVINTQRPVTVPSSDTVLMPAKMMHEYRIKSATGRDKEMNKISAFHNLKCLKQLYNTKVRDPLFALSKNSQLSQLDFIEFY